MVARKRVELFMPEKEPQNQKSKIPDLPPEKVLTEPVQFKAIADPFRIQILELLTRQPLTTKQVADILDEVPARVHYHIKVLERAGIVQLVETREKGGVLEKYYRAVADGFSFDRSVGHFSDKERQDASTQAQNLLRSIFDEAIRGLSLDGKPPREKKTGMLSSGHLRLNEKQIAEFGKKIKAFVHELQIQEDPDGKLYRYALLFFPSENFKSQEPRNVDPSGQ